MLVGGRIPGWRIFRDPVESRCEVGLWRGAYFVAKWTASRRPDSLRQRDFADLRGSAATTGSRWCARWSAGGPIPAASADALRFSGRVVGIRSRAVMLVIPTMCSEAAWAAHCTGWHATAPSASSRVICAWNGEVLSAIMLADAGLKMEKPRLALGPGAERARTGTT